MKSLISDLPPAIAQRIHPDWQKNEAEYWICRDQHLTQDRDQWIGFANGRVIASGTSAVEVFHAAQQSGLHPFVTCVGREYEPCQMRHATFSYAPTYPSEALPVITVEFRKQASTPGKEQMMDDLEKYIAKRKKRSTAFAGSFEVGYENFRVGFLLRRVREGTWHYSGGSGQEITNKEICHLADRESPGRHSPVHPQPVCRSSGQKTSCGDAVIPTLRTGSLKRET